MRRALVSLIASSVFLIVPGVAGAKVYCVSPAVGCTAGTVADPQTALDMARMNAGPDTVRLGAKSYTTSAGFTYSDGGNSANSVTIMGPPRGVATLTRTSTGIGAVLLITGSARDTLTGFRLHITQSDSYGVEGGSGDATRLAVNADPGVTGSQGILLFDGSVHDSRVTMPLSGGNIGLNTGGPAATDGVFDSNVVADVGVQVADGEIARTAVTGGASGLRVASATIDDVVVRMAGSATPRVGLDAGNRLAFTDTATARHLTILGDGAPGSVGVRVTGYTDGTLSGSQTVDLRNSIVWGVEKSFQRIGNHPADANLSVHYTDYDASASDQSGPGTGPAFADATNIDTDPLFVNQVSGDLRLRGDSRLVDRGDPAPLAADEPTTDFAGKPRVVNGKVDIGAYEYQRRPPVITSASASPVAAQTGAPLTFTAAAADPDGDPLTYAWTFDDGASAAGRTVRHAFAAQGIHLGTVTATDPAGLTASQGVAVGVLRDPKSILGSLSLSSKAFRAGSGKKRGTTVRFTLKVPTKVRFVVRRLPSLRRVKGALIRSGKLGKNRFHWAGRLHGKKLKPGRYRLIGTAGSGPNASVRRVSFTVKR